MDFRKRLSFISIFSYDNIAQQQISSPSNDGKLFTPKQWFAIKAAAFGSVGGLLFGYDLGVISGALPKLKDQFKLTTAEEELVVSLMVLGCVIGAVIGGLICDKIGRSRTFYMVSIIFLVGSYILGYAQGVFMLFIGRIIIGAAVSISAIVDVTYLTEISPSEYRGAVVSANELMITFGLLVAFLSDYLLGDVYMGWRYMFLLPIPITLIWASCMCFMPESPRWLIVQGRREEALAVFRKSMGTEIDANREFRHAVIEVDKSGRGDTRALWTDWRLATGLAIFITFLQQMSGNACVLSYTPEIFERVGMGVRSSGLSTVLIGVTKFLVTLATIPQIDRMGRRRLLLIGVAGMTASLLALSIVCYVDKDMISTEAGVISLIALCAYTAFYSVGYGPIGWLVTSEIFSDELRGRALGLATVSNWMGNLVVASTFLSLVDGAGIGGTFVIYTISCGLALLFIYVVVPETMSRQPITILKDLHARVGIPLSEAMSVRLRSLSDVDEVELSKQILMMTINPISTMQQQQQQHYNVVPDEFTGSCKTDPESLDR